MDRCETCEKLQREINDLRAVVKSYLNDTRSLNNTGENLHNYEIGTLKKENKFLLEEIDILKQNTSGFVVLARDLVSDFVQINGLEKSVATLEPIIKQKSDELVNRMSKQEEQDEVNT